jgi:hypothetical protein
MNGSVVGAKLGDDERHPLRHQAGDKMKITAQAVELLSGGAHSSAWGYISSCVLDR